MTTKADMIEVIAMHGEISETDAEKVFELYRKEKLLKLDGCCSGWGIKHGAYFDRDVILRAVDMANARAAV